MGPITYGCAFTEKHRAVEHKSQHISEASEGLVKTEFAGPHLQNFQFSGPMAGPENLYF